ncbi:MAG: hypothetical protein CM1200mP3_07310 [Chloroflexota bacterium]|nr:MAG: hypothetical protein CM1200mP3_07310 [Chloroflexota bacterium]
MGAWPALAIFLCFAWIENAYPVHQVQKAFSTDSFVLFVTFSGMTIFGKI